MSTDLDLDRRVAEIVGWELRESIRLNPAFPATVAHVPYDSKEEEMRFPTVYIEDAIAALEAMREKGWHRCILYMQHGEYTIVLHSDKPRGYGHEAVSGLAETLPLAICRAIVATQEEK